MGLDTLPAGVVLCLAGNELRAIVTYLGALRAGRPVILWGRDATAPPLPELVGRFRPAAVLGLRSGAPAPAPDGYALVEPAGLGPSWVARHGPDVAPHDDLAVLLGTSGSTGAPRLVRQSRAGVLAGATAVRAALGIGPDAVAVTTMPPFYTFGLSVVHSHLLAGATVVIDRRGVLDNGFWQSVNRHRVTSIAGVPHLYELLRRLPWRPERSPSVRTMTVSGGRLPDELVMRFHAALAERGGGMHVMYGQTEAGSRICVLPPGDLPAKLGSVGPPVPGMRLSIEVDPREPAADGSGEVVCHSPAVMMGYADSAADLALGDTLSGTLRTGDSGRLDGDGYLWLGGRLGRIGKAFGVRANLDAIEHLVADVVTAAAVPAGDRIRIWCEGADEARLAEVVRVVTTRLGLHRFGVVAAPLDRLPRRPNGKLDYRALPD
jgi:acyl-coenzyme A synthetase/AMP-(fatty) acid ligase